MHSRSSQNTLKYQYYLAEHDKDEEEGGGTVQVACDSVQENFHDHRVRFGPGPVPLSDTVVRSDQSLLKTSGTDQ